MASTAEVLPVELGIERWISRNKTEVKGDLIFVKLTVQNKGKRIPILNIMDRIPDTCTVEEGSNHWLLELDEGERITLSYSIRCHRRGRYEVGPVFVEGSDIFNFNSSAKKYPVYSSISVVPSLIKLRDLPIFRRKLLPEVGNIPSRTYKGRDFDFQGVREYQSGDEVRSINWRVTAKFNSLATNEYALDQAARVFVIFDHTISTYRLLEEGIMATLSASEYLISQRNRVAFHGIGEFIKDIQAATGKRQLLRINEYLIDVRPSYPNTDEVLDNRLNQKLLPSLPPLSHIYFISPLYNRVILKFLSKLVNHGHSVVLIVPTLDSFYENLPEEDQYEKKASQLANALLTLDRAYVLDQVSRLGIIQIPWYPNGPKSKTIKVRRTR